MKPRGCWLFILLWGALAVGQVVAQGNITVNGLGAALHATLAHHPAVSGKRAEVEAKGYAGDSARAQRLPTLDGQAGAQDDDTHPITLRVRQPLWAFGRIDSNIAFADADQAAEEADLLRVKRDLLDQTAVAYAKVLGVRQRLVVADENIAALERMQQQIKRRQEGQLASVADVRLAQARLIQGRAQKERFVGGLDVALTELRALTQVTVSSDKNVPEAVTRLPSPAELEANAQQSSADVQLKKMQVALARADVQRERAAPMPTLYAQAERYFNQPTYGDEFRVGVVLEANLDGLGFAAAGRNKAAGARLQASQEDLAATRSELVSSVDSLIANRRSQQILMESSRQSVSELREILASYQRQYEAGRKAWLDVLNIQRELVEQRLQQVEAENQWLIYSLKLAALTGRLDALAEKSEE